MRLWKDFRNAMIQTGGDADERRARNGMLGCVLSFALGLLVVLGLIVLKVIHLIVNSFYE